MLRYFDSGYHLPSLKARIFKREFHILEDEDVAYAASSNFNIILGYTLNKACFNWCKGEVYGK